MANLKLQKLPLLLILSFFLFLSCNEQNKKNLSEDQGAQTRHSETVAEKQANRRKALVDPLLYIDGQLCAWVRNIFQDSKGNLWFSTNHYGMMFYDGDSLQYIDEKDGLGGGRVTDIVEDKAGNIWIGTYRGLSKYDGSNFSLYTQKDGLIYDEIWSLELDKEGTLWIGTTEGISQFDGQNFRDFSYPLAEVSDTTTILSPYRVPTILQDSRGNLWFGTDGFGVTLFDGTDFSHISKKEGLCDDNISGLMEDSQGNIWISTMFGGISKFDGTNFKNFTKEGAIDGIEAGAMFEDKRGHIWFAAENEGVFRYDGKNFQKFSKEDGLNTHGVLAILEDREGRFWLGGWGGLFRYDGSSFNSISKDGPWD